MTKFYFTFSPKQVLWVSNVLFVDHKEEASLGWEEIEAKIQKKAVKDGEYLPLATFCFYSLSAVQDDSYAGFPCPCHTSFLIRSSI